MTAEASGSAESCCCARPSHALEITVTHFIGRLVDQPVHARSIHRHGSVRGKRDNRAIFETNLAAAFQK